MYPICLEFKAADGTIAKGAMTFLSEDKEHSHQQIQQLEQSMFEIVHENLQHPLNYWIRYSDECGPQFKSGYVVADMLRATENYLVKMYHSIILNPMRVEAVLKVLSQLYAEVNRQFVILMTYWLSFRMNPNNPPRSLIFSWWKMLDGFGRD